MKMSKNKLPEKQVANQQLVKQTNLTLIFNLINKHNPVSRAELAQMTKLSPTTVSSLTEELLHNGMVVETGAGKTSTSGRKPIMLEVNPRGGFVASVELFDDGFSCYLYDLKCKELYGTKYTVDEYDLIGNNIVKAIEEQLEAAQICDSKLLGICIGIPGLIDVENHRVISSTVIPMHFENNFYFIIKQRFDDIPVLLGNESCFYAYAEKEYGTDGDITNLVFIDINIGIGAGIIVDGQIFTGSYGMAGEVGHVTIDINGPKCKCGNRGCLETMASIPALCQKIIFAMMSGRDTVVKDIVGNDYNKIDAVVVKKAMDKGDPLVAEVSDDIAIKLAYGVNNVINLFNPQVIVIGGEITKLGDEFLARVKVHLSEIGLKPNNNVVNVKYTNLEGSTGTLGGAKYVLDNIFKSGKLLSEGMLRD